MDKSLIEDNSVTVSYFDLPIGPGDGQSDPYAEEVCANVERAEWAWGNESLRHPCIGLVTWTKTGEQIKQLEPARN